MSTTDKQQHTDKRLAPRSWAEYYQNRINPEYRAYFRKRYKPFVDRVRDMLKPHDTVVELGAGAANTTYWVYGTQPHLKHVLIDKDEEMLDLAQENIAPYLAHAVCEDVTKGRHTRADVVHSHGLLEHMSDSEIRRTVGAYLRPFTPQIHYVPSNKYTTPSFGDERLMSVANWRQICAPDEIVEFNDGYDLMLIWRRA